MTEDEQIEWPAWRLVLEKQATIVELQTVLSIDDVASANAVLDAYQDAKRRAEKQT